MEGRVSVKRGRNVGDGAPQQLLVRSELLQQPFAARDANNRHQIAHGRDVGIGPVTIKNYYTEVKRFVEFLCAELT